jgi:hypothetical protein
MKNGRTVRLLQPVQELLVHFGQIRAGGISDHVRHEFATETRMDL